MKVREVCNLTKPPPNWKPITGICVFIKKRNGNIMTQFVVKGFTQVFGIDFEETFLPVARFKTIWLLLTPAALKDWEIEVLENRGTRCEDCLSIQRSWWRDLPHTAWRFYKERSWKTGLLTEEISLWFEASYKVLHKSVTEIGFTQTHSDLGSVFFDMNNIVIMLIYVNNALFLGNNWTLLMKKKQQFMNKWESWDSGEAKEYLGMRITTDHLCPKSDWLLWYAKLQAISCSSPYWI